MSGIAAVVFDVGKVLLDWDPRHLYRKLIPDEAAMERFLAEVCPPEWNLALDRGLDWNEAISERCARFPQHAALIRAYRDRWDEMVPGEIPGTVALLEALVQTGIPCFALTNFNAHTFRRVRTRFPWFARFQGILVSGEEGLLKPEPEIYALTERRFGLDPARTLLIDDSAANVEGARACGWQALHFENAAQAADALAGLGIPIPEGLRR